MEKEMRQLEDRKRKIEDSLEEVNGQLLSLKRRYTNVGKRNTRLRSAYVRKLKFSPEKVVKDNISSEFDFEEIDNDELISACVQAESPKKGDVDNVEVVYSRTGCNRSENICSRILM